MSLRKRGAPGYARRARMITTVHLFRHGQTAWNLTTQHTGRTDLPLTEQGREEARLLGQRIAGLRFDRVLTSSLSRARETCALAGLGERAEALEDLWEWHYGAWEGRTRAEIKAAFPGWNMWTQGTPDGESIEAVVTRVDRVVSTVEPGKVTAVFAHGHILRVLACRWLGWDLTTARSLFLGNCAHSVLVRDQEGSGIELWNRLS